MNRVPTLHSDELVATPSVLPPTQTVREPPRKQDRMLSIDELNQFSSWIRIPKSSKTVVCIVDYILMNPLKFPASWSLSELTITYNMYSYNGITHLSTMVHQRM